MTSDELISGYLDESLSEADQQELAAWIKADPAHAREFARAVMLHDRLNSEVQAAGEAVIEGDESPDAKVVQFPGIPAVAKWLVPLAAVLLLLLSLQFRPVDEGGQQIASPALAIPNAIDFASLANVVDAEFGPDSKLELGQRLGAQWIELKSGFVRLEFDSGVLVTLQGPARYEILSADRTRLSSGRLTATVPPGAEGFRVDTPTAEVTDLGTAFGVELDESGASQVIVFEGEVAVAEPGSSESKLLREGEALRIERGKGLATVAFDEKPFEKLFPIQSGIAGSTGAFRLIAPWRRFRFASSDEFIFIRPEGHRIQLVEPLRVNISEPGHYVFEEQLTPTDLPTGQRVRSVLLHHQPESARVANVKRLTGSITFERPILGVIVLHEELIASAGRFSPLPAGEGHPRREIDLNGRPVGDAITLSEDRRTLTLDLASPLNSSDLIRVIVDASPPRMMVQAE